MRFLIAQVTLDTCHVLQNDTRRYGQPPKCQLIKKSYQTLNDKNVPRSIFQNYIGANLLTLFPKLDH